MSPARLLTLPAPTTPCALIALISCVGPEVQGRVAVLAVERPPYCLAVDRDLPGSASIGPEHRADPVQEAALEALRVDQHQHPAEGVVRGDAAPQLEEALQPIPLA